MYVSISDIELFIFSCLSKETEYLREKWFQKLDICLWALTKLLWMKQQLNFPEEQNSCDSGYSST